MSSTPLLCSMVCFVSVAAAVCRAEQITLSNGDRLTGTVQRLSGGKVVIETDYAGEVSIDLKSIASIVTEGEMTVVLDNDTRTFGQLSGDGQRRFSSCLRVFVVRGANSVS